MATVGHMFDDNAKALSNNLVDITCWQYKPLEPRTMQSLKKWENYTQKKGIKIKIPFATSSVGLFIVVQEQKKNIWVTGARVHQISHFLQVRTSLRKPQVQMVSLRRRIYDPELPEIGSNGTENNDAASSKSKLCSQSLTTNKDISF